MLLRWCREAAKFAPDSPVERTGFEPSVPGRERLNPFPGMGTVTEAIRGSLDTVSHLCREHSHYGEGSNYGALR